MKSKSLLVVLFVSLLPGPLAGQDGVALSQQACDAGDMLSCSNLGLMYGTGTDVLQDPARAASLFQRACDGGLMLGCTHLGLLHQNGVGVTPDLAGAVFLFERACDGGDMLGCATLGVSYERGDGVTQDPARAVSLYERACGGGEMLGCTNLGSMYRTGTGVTEDLGTAVSLYWLACDGGVMVSCINLAVSYERGEGVTPNVAIAVSLYQRACEAAVTLACDRIGVTYEPPDAEVASADGFGRAGWVVDTETRDPLDEAIVDVPELGIRVITDGSGRVELGELPTGRHRIYAERVAYEVMEGDLLVPGDREVTILMDRATLDDIRAPGRIVGRVLEGGREDGVSNVDITVLTSTPVRTLSDPRGRFDLTGVEPGLVEVRFERLGYRSRTATVIVQPAGTVQISASLSAQPIELEPIEVVVRSRFLERNGFYLRGFAGYQLTRREIAARKPVVTSSLLRTRMGVMVREGAFGPPTVIGRQGCQLPVFLNGVEMEDWDFNTIPPDWLEGMEVYKGAYVPPEYQSRSQNCGVVLLWMR